MEKDLPSKPGTVTRPRTIAKVMRSAKKVSSRDSVILEAKRDLRREEVMMMSLVGRDDGDGGRREGEGQARASEAASNQSYDSM